MIVNNGVTSYIISEFQLKIFSATNDKVTNFKAIAGYLELVSSTLAKIESENIIEKVKTKKMITNYGGIK